MNAPRRPDHDGVLQLLAKLEDSIVMLEEWTYAEKQFVADQKHELATLKARVAELEKERGPVDSPD